MMEMGDCSCGNITGLWMGYTGAKFVFLTTAIANLNFDTIDKCIDARVITATLFSSSFFPPSFSWVVFSMLAIVGSDFLNQAWGTEG